MVLTSYTVNEHRPSTADVLKTLEGRQKLRVVAGISFSQYKQRDLRELADELAAEFDVPVMVHSGDTFSRTAKIKYAHPLELDEVAVDFPEVKFVICHLGNPWFRDCMEVVYKNRNVYADFSGLVLGDFSSRFQSYLKKQLDEFLLYAGESSWLLYGTDWPICSMQSYIQFISGIRMNQKDKDRILYGNAARLFRIAIPTAPPVEATPPRKEELSTHRARARGASARQSRSRPANSNRNPGR